MKESVVINSALKTMTIILQIVQLIRLVHGGIAPVTILILMVTMVILHSERMLN